MASPDLQEALRLQLQRSLDSETTFAHRNRLGQFATPTALADNILEFAFQLSPKRKQVRFLDPAFGTGAFYSSLLRIFPRSRITKAQGIEIDSRYGDAAQSLWAHESLRLSIADFTREKPPAVEPDRATLVICNPPYVRHHHLTTSDKKRLQQLVQQQTGIRLNGLAGLYCYFLLLTHAWMATDALAGWLIPSEFMDVNYGEQVKDYLLDKVKLLHIHRFAPQEVQFDDALVSSAVVWFRNTPPPKNHLVTFSYGGSLSAPELVRMLPASTLRKTPKWTRFPTEQTVPVRHEVRLSDLFQIKRGVATGANDFFVLTSEQVNQHQLPPEFLQPVLPSPRDLVSDEIEADEDGNPIAEPKRFLLSCTLPEDQLQREYPELWTYLERGIASGVNTRYLCRHRTPWYSQEIRPAAPFLCTYMGRHTDNSRPFRFVLNHSKATALNVYLLLYPKPALASRILVDQTYRRAVWEALRNISVAVLKGEGRTYGGGLHKIEPNELSNAPWLPPTL